MAFPSWRHRERWMGIRPRKKRTRREAGWGCKARWWYAAPMAWRGYIYKELAARALAGACNEFANQPEKQRGGWGIYGPH